MLRSLWQRFTTKLLRRPSQWIKTQAVAKEEHHPPGFDPSIIITAPGPKPGKEMTIFDIAGGLQRLEILATIARRQLFLKDPLRVDHYGTLENPIIVPSTEDSRIVGCTGFPKYSHFPLWFNLIGTNRCHECGQAFRLHNLDKDGRLPEDYYRLRDEDDE